MARLVHPTGELDIAIRTLFVDESQLVVQGKMGVWEANIFVPIEEAGQLARLAMRHPSILLFFLKAIFR